MRMLPERELRALLGPLPGVPRIVVSGNYATPREALDILDRSAEQYRLFALNAQPDMPDRDGVVLESPFVGPGMRRRHGLRYLPCRLSLVPRLLKESLPPDGGIGPPSPPVPGTAH